MPGDLDPTNCEIKFRSVTAKKYLGLMANSFTKDSTAKIAVKK